MYNKCSIVYYIQIHLYLYSVEVWMQIWLPKKQSPAAPVSCQRPGLPLKFASHLGDARGDSGSAVGLAPARISSSNFQEGRWSSHSVPKSPDPTSKSGPNAKCENAKSLAEAPAQEWAFGRAHGCQLATCMQNSGLLALPLGFKSASQQQPCPQWCIV